jgi:hypothetical protein
MGLRSVEYGRLRIGREKSSSAHFLSWLTVRRRESARNATSLPYEIPVVVQDLVIYGRHRYPALHGDASLHQVSGCGTSTNHSNTQRSKAQRAAMSLWVSER